MQGEEPEASPGFDVIVSLLLVIITAPFMLAAAIAIRLDSPGPLLFRFVIALPPLPGSPVDNYYSGRLCSYPVRENAVPEHHIL